MVMMYKELECPSLIMSSLSHELLLLLLLTLVMVICCGNALSIHIRFSITDISTIQKQYFLRVAVTGDFPMCISSPAIGIDGMMMIMMKR